MKVRQVALAACLAAAACLLVYVAITFLRPASAPGSTAGVPPTSTPRTGTIDRVVDGALAVILIDGEAEELIVPASRLPENTRAGDWLVVRQEEGAALSLEPDPAATADAARRIEAKLQALRERGPKPTSP